MDISSPLVLLVLTTVLLSESAWQGERLLPVSTRTQTGRHCHECHEYTGRRLLCFNLTDPEGSGPWSPPLWEKNTIGLLILRRRPAEMLLFAKFLSWSPPRGPPYSDQSLDPPLSPCMRRGPPKCDAFFLLINHCCTSSL